MSNLIIPQRIYCDEAGYTGPFLLDASQPLFAYSSVAISADEADDLIAQIRADFRPQGDELKGKNLMRSASGRRAVHFALARLRDRYIVSGYDKKLSLAAKFFEYVFEPVLARNSLLFYSNNFHRFVAALVYLMFLNSEAGLVDLVAQFERFMRTFDPNDAPAFFGDGELEMREPLQDLLNFIVGYRDLIAAEARDLARVDPETGEVHGKWTLDLTSSAVWSHLSTWTERKHILDVVCDESKPLASALPLFNMMVNKPDIPRMRFEGKERPMTFNLAKPVATGSSKAHAGLQIADLVSSAFAQAINRSAEPWSRTFLEEMQPQAHEDCILADLDYMKHMDLHEPAAAINCVVLRELGQRAKEGADPLDGMQRFYAIAKASVHQFIADLPSRTELV